MEESKKQKRKKKETLLVARDRLLKDMSMTDPGTEEYQKLNTERAKLDADLLKYKEIKTNRNTQLIKTGIGTALLTVLGITEANGKFVLRDGVRFVRGLLSRGLF